MQAGNILFIDAYDSFSNSIIALLKSELDVAVESIKIDDDRFVLNDEAFFTYLDGFDAVVAGPGPGHPTNAEDVGLIGRLWQLPDEHTLPILGICLGFQSLCHAFGGRVKRLTEPRHGIMAIVTHCGKDIFQGAGKVVATQYHSLHVQLQESDVALGRTHHVWQPFQQTGELLPLAWDLMNVTNGPVLMAVRHRHKPFWGVQYHPESICTNESGGKLIANWWQRTREWGRITARVTRSPPISCKNQTTQEAPKPTRHATSLPEDFLKCQVQYETVDLSCSFDLARFVDVLRKDSKDSEPFLLESGTRNGRAVNPETGRFSIIGLRDASALQIRFSTSARQLVVQQDNHIVSESSSSVQEAFRYIDDLIEHMKARDGPSDSPFWGGLIGFISYEAGLETIDVLPSKPARSRPDLWFVLVNRSIVVDNVKKVAYIQTIRGDDNAWMALAHDRLQSMSSDQPMESISLEANRITGAIVKEPRMDEYYVKIDACQSNLRAGESYELCLTDQTTVTSPTEPWPLYCHLRQRNPAPFSSYLRFACPSQPGISIVSSSPERFLSWTRQGQCQFRPIKGTVKKTAAMTRAKAETILGSAKERAENLMIVDLIRHDLIGVQGVDRVRVPKLMSVEEYETVFQLVSVIEGTFASSSSSSTSPTAALAASLPPGSMTGAPKKRSCELLKGIEGESPRGLYSGVIGYFDVGGGGDFSVVIRTAYKWDDMGDEWQIGAGGAITALSETDAEWEEMLAKRESVLRSFL